MFEDVQTGLCLDYENYVICTCGTDKVPGLWLDHVICKIITEYVLLRAKTNFVKFADGECIMKNKGIKSNATVTHTYARTNFDVCQSPEV